VSDDSTGVPPAESTPSLLIAESKIEAAPFLSTLPASAPELAAVEAPHGISADTSPDKSGAAPSGKQETASPSTLPPSFLELHAAATDRREFVIAKPGPVEISIPGGLPDELRESLEQGQESPVWSPAGGAAKEAVMVDVSSSPVIENIDLATGKRRVIVEDASEGSWSPDGRYFAYVDTDFCGITVFDTGSGSVRRISESGRFPCFTPDGASIIYIDWKGSEAEQLFRISLAGGKPEQLTTDGNWWEPKISPDGEWVLCSGFGFMQYGRNALVRAFNLRNRMSYFILVEGSETPKVGTWSPSGRQFCYTRNDGIVKDGSTVSRSTIYIDQFQPSSLTRPAEETAQPHEFKLVGNFPNPFNPSTTIRFSLPSAGTAELDVYNMLGQKIRSLVSGRMEAGMHSILWNGRDQENRPVSSGTYVARLKMEGKVETRRMTLVK
jgi:hypothetical protein